MVRVQYSRNGQIKKFLTYEKINTNMVRVQYSRNGQIKKFLTYEKIKRLLWNITVYSGLQITNVFGEKHMRKMKNEKKTALDMDR